MSTETTTTWRVTYHNGDVDDVTAHACERIGGTIDFRDSNGELQATVATSTYRSLIRLDALIRPEGGDEKPVAADDTAYLLANDANADRLLGAVGRLEPAAS